MGHARREIPVGMTWEGRCRCCRSIYWFKPCLRQMWSLSMAAEGYRFTVLTEMPMWRAVS